MAQTINTLEREFYIDVLGLPADTDMSLNDLRYEYYSNPPAGGGGDPTMGGDLTGLASNAQIAAGAVGGTEIAAAIKDPAAATAGLRTLGTGAAQAAAGNDSRITGAEQVANKGATNGYAALSSGTVPIAQIPTGTSSTTVAIGNDSRITGAQQTSAKDQNNGYAGLDSGGLLSIARLPAGSTVVVRKAAGIWPGGDADTGVRPTSRTDITVIWQGADPSPAIVASGTGGMLDDVDVRWITP